MLLRLIPALVSKRVANKIMSIGHCTKIQDNDQQRISFRVIAL